MSKESGNGKLEYNAIGKIPKGPKKEGPEPKATAPEKGDIREARVIVMATEDLATAKDNPRDHDTKEVHGIGQSVRQFGLVEFPIYNERTKRLVNGHARVMALRKMGVKECQVALVDLTADGEMALRLALHNAALRGRFNKKALSQAKQIEKLDRDLFVQLNLGAIADQIGGDAKPGEEEKEVKFTKNKGGGITLRFWCPKVRGEAIMDKVQRFVKHNGVQGKDSDGYALEMMLADVEIESKEPVTREPVEA